MSKYFSDSEDGEKDHSKITNQATIVLVKTEPNQTESYNSLHIVKSILENVIDEVFESEKHMPESYSDMESSEILSESQRLISDSKSVIMSSQKFDDRNIEEEITDTLPSNTIQQETSDFEANNLLGF